MFGTYGTGAATAAVGVAAKTATVGQLQRNSSNTTNTSSNSAILQVKGAACRREQIPRGRDKGMVPAPPVFTCDCS